MTTRLAPVDVVLVGFGWTASIVGHALTKTGLEVLALERGKFRDTVPDFATTHVQDELRYAVRRALFERPARETLTFRNSVDQTALPMRHLGSFLPAAGVGGAGVHWNGQTWRFLPEDFVVRSHTVERYGKKFIPADMTIQDWASPMPSSSRTTTASSTCAASRARPATSAARSSPAAILSKGRARAPTRCRRSPAAS